MKKGELVCKARYLEALVGAPRWYEPVEINTTVRLQQVAATALQLQEASEESSLPNNFRNKTQAVADGAKRILEEDHFKAIDESTLQEIVDHEEDSDNDDIEDRSDGKESLDEDSDLEEDEEET